MKRVVLEHPGSRREWARLPDPARQTFRLALQRLADPARPLVAREHIERDGRLFLIVEDRGSAVARRRLMAVEVVGTSSLIVWACGSERAFHDRLRRRLREMPNA